MFGKKKPAIISNETPLEIGPLKVYPDKLEYKDIRCNFLDIEHIGWYWRSETVNVINTQEATMTLYLRGRERPISIKKSTMYVTPKIVTAYNFIANIHFRTA